MRGKKQRFLILGRFDVWQRKSKKIPLNPKQKKVTTALRTWWIYSAQVGQQLHTSLEGTRRNPNNYQILKKSTMPRHVKILGLLGKPKPRTAKLQGKYFAHYNIPKKGTVLSDIRKFYAPTWLDSPILFSGQDFGARLWLTGLNWDEKLPAEFSHQEG
ncbi:hypothetical protein JTE90_021035 [Oedothorax gibbosus]|uniref:Uncharacterized protein n=1 Tax=Oedothorax gibbosus TaxID=931172 RepID=A0AAV6TCX0_9ARAC|nr:hypothetical protein JTE90_021035 [Oedothorax gibbosus]